MQTRIFHSQESTASKKGLTKCSKQDLILFKNKTKLKKKNKNHLSNLHLVGLVILCKLVYTTTELSY